MQASNWDFGHMVKCDIYSAYYTAAFQERAANILSKKDHISLCVKENKSRSRVGHQAHGIILKSDNLQYNTLVCWFAGTNDSSTKLWCSKYYLIFTISCKILCKITSIYFCKFTKMKIKSFECPISIRNYEKNDALNIRCLVDESFVPATQRTSVLYCRLSDFWF